MTSAYGWRCLLILPLVGCVDPVAPPASPSSAPPAAQVAVHDVTVRPLDAMPSARAASASAGSPASKAPLGPPTPTPFATISEALDHRDELVAHWDARLRNHLSRVIPGNQLPLAERARDFAHYLQEMHVRVHPLFGDEGLDRWAAGREKENLRTRIELVVDATGQLVDVGVLNGSGSPVFDALVLEAFARAAPFGTPPAATLSSDGRLYVQWSPSSDPTFACSTMGAHPYLLEVR